MFKSNFVSYSAHSAHKCTENCMELQAGLYVYWRGQFTSPNRARVSDRVRNRDKLHASLAVVDLGYGGPEPDQIWSTAP